MIKVCIIRSPGGVVQDISVSGHANQGPYGYDIVCAAVSALAETLVIGLTQVAPVAMEHHLNEGILTITLQEYPSERTQALLETFCLGLQDLAYSEPKFVKYGESVADRELERRN